jgi:hypothetical protein
MVPLKGRVRERTRQLTAEDVTTPRKATSVNVSSFHQPQAL